MVYYVFQKSYQQMIPPDFQKKYANIVLELEKLNKDLNEYLKGVQQFCQEVRQLFTSCQCVCYFLYSDIILNCTPSGTVIYISAWSK